MRRGCEQLGSVLQSKVHHHGNPSRWSRCGISASWGASSSRLSAAPASSLASSAEERHDLQSYRRAFDRVSIPDSLERIVNQHMKVRLTGSQVLYRMLQSRNIEFVFGYSGGAVLPLVDMFHVPSGSSTNASRSKPIQFVNTAHEQAAAHAAQAVGKATGKPGVVVVTSGPGLTNCITAMQDAFMDGNPLIVFSGQVPTHAMGTDAFQECPATALTKPCTKWNYLVQDVESLPWAVETAFRVSMSGRKGPVHVDLPKDVLASEGEIPVALVCPGPGKDLGEEAAARSNTRLLAEFDDSVVDQVCKRIELARCPVLIAGAGAIDCFDIVRNLAMKCDIPIATTLLGLGIFPEDSALSLHMLGMHGSAYANYAVQNADLIISIGARFDDRTTGALPLYAPCARASPDRGGIVQFEIEPRQIGKTVTPDISVIGDCAFTVQRLLSKAPTKQHKSWREQIHQWKIQHPFSWEDDIPPGKLKTQQVIVALHEAMQDQTIRSNNNSSFRVCTGVGNHQMMTAQFFRWTQPRQLITSGGLGTMGTGLPFAIGTQTINRDSLVLLIDGDGSFNMSSSELGTVTKFGLPLKMAIMNDGVQQMVRAWQDLFFEGRWTVTDNANPDFTKLAGSYGIEARQCSAKSELKESVEWLLGSPGPALVDFQVIPDFCLPLVKPGSALDDMLLKKEQIKSAKPSVVHAPS